MGFRTVRMKNRSKLDLKMNYLVCRSEEQTKVFIPEISTLILESTAISLTSALLSELIKNNVKIIFCDEKHNPESELVSYYGNYNVVENIKKQFAWTEQTRGEVWSEIVKNKILQQKNFLDKLALTEESDMLKGYIEDIAFNDLTNREGHAAKVYFNAIFGNNFGRRDENFINRALNYGYSVLLSCFNREIVKMGYLTQIGIWHKNEFNFFNLSSDLMEPFRILVDRLVYEITEEKNYKSSVLDMMNVQVIIDGKKQFLENAITIYCQSIFNALNSNNKDLIKFYEI